jgi:hypothetical protein
MKIILFTIITAFTLTCVQAQDTVQVSCDIKVKFSPTDHTNVVEKSVSLLSSCAFMDTHLPQEIADVQKQSHLDFVFATPRTVEVPIMKTTVKVREMVIKMPLITGGIWVRTDDGIIYFSKYNYTVLQELEKLLLEAQQHDTGV